MKSHFTEDEIETIRKQTIKIARASLVELNSNPTGIGYKPDELFGMIIMFLVYLDLI
jgi:hypothetical protein